jgi:hypothetical protein
LAIGVGIVSANAGVDMIVDDSSAVAARIARVIGSLPLSPHVENADCTQGRRVARAKYALNLKEIMSVVTES